MDVLFFSLVGLITLYFFLPKVSAGLRELRRRNLYRILAGDDLPNRTECRDWLGTLSAADLEFARPLVSCGNPTVELEIARRFVAKAKPIPDDALEALVRVGSIGSDGQREEAIRMLLLARHRCQSIVRPLIARLAEEPNGRVRLDILLTLVEMAKEGSSDRLDSWSRAEILQAVAKRLADSSCELRNSACESLCGILSHSVKDAELVLMQLLRGHEQYVADLAAQVSLAPKNRAALIGARSCIPVSAASPGLVNRVLGSD